MKLIVVIIFIYYCKLVGSVCLHKSNKTILYHPNVINVENIPVYPKKLCLAGCKINNDTNNPDELNSGDITSRNKSECNVIIFHRFKINNGTLSSNTSCYDKYNYYAIISRKRNNETLVILLAKTKVVPRYNERCNLTGGKLVYAKQYFSIKDDYIMSLNYVRKEAGMKDENKIEAITVVLLSIIFLFTFLSIIIPVIIIIQLKKNARYLN